MTETETRRYEYIDDGIPTFVVRATMIYEWRVKTYNIDDAIYHAQEIPFYDWVEVQNTITAEPEGEKK